MGTGVVAGDCGSPCWNRNMVEVIALSRQASGLTKGQRQGNLWDARAIEGTSVTGCSLLSHPGADTGSRKTVSHFLPLRPQEQRSG